MDRRVAVLSAGGTGGHLFPAEALAAELSARGWTIHLATDERAERYSSRFPAEAMHVIRSATPSGRNPMEMARSLLALASGFWQARRLLARLRPAVVVGFGGYPTLPPLIAAQLARIPNMIHDANAVMGRANRLLARRADAVAVGFPGVTEGAVVTGNPVRPIVLEAAAVPYPGRGAADPFRMLVFGGSQGAQFFGDAVPAAIGLLDADHRGRLSVVQQVREEQIETVTSAYRNLGVTAEIAPFFADLPERIAHAHFVIGRAGASTVSELGVIGRPSLLVPLPHAIDQDQARNAASLAQAGGASTVAQAELAPERLASILENAMDAPEGLALMAEKAKKTSRPDAARSLADLAERLAAGPGDDRNSRK